MGELLSLEAIVERIRAEERLTAAQFQALDRARAIEMEEMRRRLDALNGEQARLLLDRERYLPRELYDAGAQELRIWRENVTTQMAAMRGRDTGVGMAWAVAVALITLFIAGTGMFLAFAR